MMMKRICRVIKRTLKLIPTLAYIHIPKTGGSYLAQHGSEQTPVLLPMRNLGHIYVVDTEEIPNPLYYPRDLGNSGRVMLLEDIRYHTVVSTVRNIFSWLVSYAGHAGGWNPKYRDTEHYDFDAADKGFDYLLNTMANREEPWPSRKFIHCQLFCSSGQLVVDWISRTETLDDDLSELASVANAIYTPGPKRRVGKHKDYREYYDDSLIELVCQTWGRELDLFGYSFELPESASNSLYRAIDKNDKESIRYCWIDDRLLIDATLVDR